MNSTESQISQIEATLGQNKATKEFADALLRLKSNRDFKTVVLAGYFEKEAVRLVHLLSDPNMQTVEKQSGILSDIRAVGAFKQFLETAIQLGNVAEKGIAYAEQELDELRQEVK